MGNPRWRPRNGCDGRLMVKILVTTIQVNLVPLGQLAQNSPELSLLKFLPLTYHHSHFLAATLDFTSFFTIAFLRAAPFLTAWLFWIRISLLFVFVYPKAGHSLWPALGLFNLSFFSLLQEEEKMKQGDFFVADLCKVILLADLSTG